MPLTRRSLAALALAFSLLATPAALEGQSTSDILILSSTYAFHKPKNWNGRLMIRLADVAVREQTRLTVGGFVPEPNAGPLGEQLLAEGYAIGAVTYQGEDFMTRKGGYGVFTASTSVSRLIAKFIAEVSTPSGVFLYGEGVGGLIAVQMAEKNNIGANVTGALAMCSPLAGSRKWDAVLDLRLAYDAVCSEAGAKAQIPGGATGLPEERGLFNGWFGSSSVFTSVRTVGNAVNACTGVDTAPKLRSDAQQAALDQLVELTTRPEQSLQRNMWWATGILHDMTFDPNQLDGAIGVGNQKVRYPDDEIDEAIERVKPNNKAAKRLAKFYTPTGKLGTSKVLALHSDQDGENVVEHLSEYADRASSTSFLPVVVVEPEPTHCGFTPAERLAAWESLVAWTQTGVQPHAAGVQAACEVHAGVRTAAGPCRIDPEFKIGDLDDRILAR